mmetsp:Transcript_31621/g.57521  ORF Transcript_31621/g.57521 Transcript_31621/m.57521 type:complete len:556 (+) Transcript_31621:76-1743(+)
MVVSNENTGASGWDQLDQEFQTFLQEITKAYVKPPKYTMDSLWSDRDLILRILREHREGWRLVKFVNKEFQADRDILLAAMRGSTISGWRVIAFAAEEFRADHDLCLEAVRRNAAALELFTPALRENQMLISESLATLSRKMQVKCSAPQLMNSEKFEAARQAAEKDKNPAKRHIERSTTQVMGDDLSWGERLQREETENRDDMQVVPICCVQLMEQGGNILAKLGTHTVGARTIKVCHLPGTKMQDQEAPRDAATRVLSGELHMLAKGISPLSNDFEVDTQDGRSISTNTPKRYLISKFGATLTPGFKWSVRVQFLSTELKKAKIRKSHVTNLGRRFCSGKGDQEPVTPDIFWFPNDKDQKLELGNKIRLFAWIPPWEFDWLRHTESGKNQLLRWLAHGGKDLEVEHKLLKSASKISFGRSSLGGSTLPSSTSLVDAEANSGDEEKQRASKTPRGLLPRVHGPESTLAPGMLLHSARPAEVSGVLPVVLGEGTKPGTRPLSGRSNASRPRSANTRPPSASLKLWLPALQMRQKVMPPNRRAAPMSHRGPRMVVR